MTRNRIRTSLATATVIAGVLLTGCSDPEPTAIPEPKPTATATNTPVNQPVNDEDDTKTAPPAVKHVDEISVERFGQPAIDALPNEMARIVALSLGNPDLAAGRVEPRDVIATLPLAGDAIKNAARNPLGLTMDTLGGDVAPVAPFAEVRDGGAFNVDYEVVTVAGEPVLEVEFTGRGRVWFDQAGQTYTGDYERDYTLHLVPSGQQDGPNWYVTAYRTSEIRFDDQKPVRE